MAIHQEIFLKFLPFMATGRHVCGCHYGERLGRHVTGFVEITGLEETEARSEMGATVRTDKGWEWRNEGCVTPVPSPCKNGAMA